MQDFPAIELVLKKRGKQRKKVNPSTFRILEDFGKIPEIRQRECFDFLKASDHSNKPTNNVRVTIN